MLQRLKTFSTDQVDLEELIYLSSVAGAMAAEYEGYGIEAPEWLPARQKELGREVKSRIEDSRLKRVRDIKARLESMKPEAQKRRELQSELTKLEKQLED